MVGTKSRNTRIRAGCQRASTRCRFSAPVTALVNIYFQLHLSLKLILWTSNGLFKNIALLSMNTVKLVIVALGANK